MNRELRILAAFGAIFRVAYCLPLATPEFQQGTNPTNAKVTTAIIEAFVLLQWYARTHMLAGVVPALLIAGMGYGTMFPENPGLQTPHDVAAVPSTTGG